MEPGTAGAVRSDTDLWLGGSEMAERIRELDWSATSLGPRSGWPDELKVALGICLRSRFQMAIYWGPELVCFYNDAEREILGGLHPAALGMPARELLRDSWDVVGPQLGSVIEDGASVWAEDEELVFDRFGTPEVGFFTYSYSPLADLEGVPLGVLLVTEDTTERVLSSRRGALLRRLGAGTAAAGSEAEAYALATEALAGHPDVPGVLVYTLDGDGARVRCTASVGFEAGAGTIPLRSDGLPGQGTRVDIGPYLAGEAPPGCREGMVSLVGGAEDEVAGFVLTGLADRLGQSSRYRTFLEFVGNEVARSVVAASARAARRRHDRAMAELDAANAEARGRLEERGRNEEELRGLLAELQAARRRVASAGDAERRRIERNLHDGAQQKLVAVQLKMGLVGERIAEDPARARTELDTLSSELETALEEIRELAHGLYPPLLESDGLGAALLAVARHSAVPVTLQVDGVGRMSASVESAMYFCCLEALQNVSKHAGGAARVSVRLEALEGVVRFTVVDDGVGFDPRQARTGTGLVNLRDRLTALGGDAEVTAAPGRGVTATGWVPIAPREEPQKLQMTGTRKVATTKNSTSATSPSRQ